MALTCAAMKTPDAKPPAKPTPQEARQQRRAQALRDNLRRRKTVKTPAPPSENDG
jgi:hypothetical protein